MRARPAVVSKEFLTRQIEEEGRSLAQAKSLLSAFKLKHNIDSVTREINSYQDLVRSTKVSSDNASVEAQRAARLAEEADLLVMGRRGSEGFTGLHMGSTAQHVLYETHCPIVMLPQQD